jgi:hypothetical protein
MAKKKKRKKSRTQSRPRTPEEQAKSFRDLVATGQVAMDPVLAPTSPPLEVSSLPESPPVEIDEPPVAELYVEPGAVPEPDPVQEIVDYLGLKEVEPEGREPGTTLEEVAEVEEILEDDTPSISIEELRRKLGLDEPTEMPENQVARDIRTYCTGHSVSLVLKRLCEEVPEALPNYRTWDVEEDPIPQICEKLQEPGYVEELIPGLYIMMGTNLGNTSWAARVCIAIATYDVVRNLAKKAK